MAETEAAPKNIITPDELQAVVDHVRKSPEPSLAPFIGLLGWEGKPLSLDDHFQFSPIFRTDIPQNMLLMCGRQEGKSMQAAARGDLLAITKKYLRQLIITPLHSQIQRYSREYVAGMLAESPFRNQFVDKQCRQNLLEREFTNGSAMVFSYAYLDSVRLRSIAGIDLLHVDELQSMNPDYIPVAQATMAASKHFQCTFFSGTPLSMDNEIQRQWELSSMGIWTIMCPACRRENIADVHHDAIGMIGRKGPICVKCGHALDTRTGYYLHKRPDRLNFYPGYNISQIVHPYHCEYEQKWRMLLHYYENWEQSKFVNEILGSSFDSARQPITMEQLHNCCDPNHKNTIEAAADMHRGADFVILAIDWSGNGILEKSTTGITCIAKMPGDDRLRITYMERLPPVQDHMVDAYRVRELAGLLEVDHICHDYGGAGDVRETTLRQAGIPGQARIIPITLVYAPKQRIFRLPPRTASAGRRAYQLDKARGLDYMYALMRKGQIVLPSWDTCRDMAEDFLNNALETHETPRGSPYILYVQRKGRVNDIAMSALLGLFSGWWILGKIPNLTGGLSQEELEDMDATV